MKTIGRYRKIWILLPFLVVGIVMQFGSCRFLQPIPLLQGLWRHECQKRISCFARFCNVVPQRMEWKSKAEIDIEENLSAYKGRATNGEVSAQIALGSYYENDILTPRDDVESLKWYRLAAEAGNSIAQMKVGELLDPGIGHPSVTSDAIAAADWYGKAANQGEMDSILYLSRLKSDTEDGFFWRYIFFCIAESPANIENSSEDVIKNCPEKFPLKTDRTQFDSQKMDEIKQRAKQWIRQHKIKPHHPGSTITF